MPEQGKSVVLESGKRGIQKNGKGAVYNEDGKCSTCCECEPFVLAQTVTNSSNRTWDLTPYQGPDQAPPGTYWRLIELGSCYPGGYPWYGAGCVDGDGKLAGLQGSFTGQSYNGYMDLQIGCESDDGTQIEWPGSCQTTSYKYSC